MAIMLMVQEAGDAVEIAGGDAVGSDPAGDVVGKVGGDSLLVAYGAPDRFAGMSPEQVEIDALRGDLQRLQAKVADRDRMQSILNEASTVVDRAAADVLSCESVVEEAKGDLKAAKEKYDRAVNELREIVRDAANGQGRFNFDGKPAAETPATDAPATATDTPAAPEDPAVTASITELGKKLLANVVGVDEFRRAANSEEPIGLTDKQIETIEGKGCTTIADLERKLRNFFLAI